MADLSKDTYKKALATVLGAEIIRPGTTGVAARKALVSGTKAILAGTLRYAPVAARTGLRTGIGVGRLAAGISPQGLALLGGLTVAEAYQRGLLDEPIDRGQEVFADTIAEGIERTRPFMPDTVPEGFQGFRRPKKRTTKHNRAVKAGMAAVKKSKFGGKKGTISNAKTTFGTVNKTISMLKKGKKAPKSGIKGTIAKSVKRFI